MSDGKQPVQVVSDPRMLLGEYSNITLVTWGGSDFTLDFVRQAPNLPNAVLVARVMVSPHHMKRVIAALQTEVGKFEATYGELKVEPDQPQVVFEAKVN